jgi:hypothetical protein
MASPFRRSPGDLFDDDLIHDYEEDVDPSGLIADRKGQAGPEVLDDFWEAPAGGGPTSVSATGSGGVVLGGSAPATRNRSASGAGGAVLGGSAGAARSRLAATPQGGLVLGGSSPVARARPAAGAGGAVLGGSAGGSRGRALAGSGGAVLGGAADASAVPAGPGNTSASATMDGGVVLGGSADAVAVPYREPAPDVGTFGGGGTPAAGVVTDEDLELILLLAQAFLEVVDAEIVS